MALRLATFNVENLFARAKALDTTDSHEGEPVVAAFATFNNIAAKPVYSDQDKADLLAALETLEVLVRTPAGELRANRHPFDAWALLRENRGDFLVAPNNAEPRIEADGRGDWIGWVDLITEPVDEVAIRMTARVISDVAADVLCVIEAEDRPSLARFNEELLDGRYGHAMLIDGNDPRGIDVGLFCDANVDLAWMRSNVDRPDPESATGRPLFSRDCPVHSLRLPSGAELFLLINHLKSQSFSSGNPDPLRSRQSAAVREIYDQLREDGAEHVAVLGDMNKGPDRDDPTRHPTLEPLLGPGTPLVDAYGLPGFDVGNRPGSFQSCGISNRLDYILLSPELAAHVTGGGVFRKGLWGNPTNKFPPKPELWTIYPEITAARHGASDHAAVWVDLDL
jgi:endonuclease/exonuclease/phosphatase family metal-dependent hydrolase